MIAGSRYRALGVDAMAMGPGRWWSERGRVHRPGTIVCMGGRWSHKMRDMGGWEKKGKKGAKDNKINEDTEEGAVDDASEGPGRKECGHQGEKARGSCHLGVLTPTFVAKTNLCNKQIRQLPTVWLSQCHFVTVYGSTKHKLGRHA